MQIRPKRLGVCQRGVDGRDERGAPQVGRRPPIGTEFGGGGERERGGVEEGDEPGEEEAAVGDDLSCQARRNTYRDRDKGKGERGHQPPRYNRAGVRTNEASKSAQGDWDTTGNGLRRTTGGTSVQTSIARVCPSINDSGSSERSAMGGNEGTLSTSAWTRMYSRGPTPEIMKDEGTPRRGAERALEY